MTKRPQDTEASPRVQPDVRRRLAEADLITGIIALDEYSRLGPPGVLSSYLHEPPEATRDRILRDVEPSDLSPGAGPLWARAKAVWVAGKPLTWTTLLAGAPQESKTFAEWAQQHGMGVAYQTVPAARRVIAYATGTQAYTEAREAAVEALEQTSSAFHGVVGG